jgi:hypothetical protein
LRKLLVEGARAAFARLNRSQHSFGSWMDALEARKHNLSPLLSEANR